MREQLQKVKYFIEDHHEKLYYGALAVLLGLMGFLLGKMSEIEHKKAQIHIESAVDVNTAKSAYNFITEANMAQNEGMESQNSSNLSNQAIKSTAQAQGNYVASKNGKSYHLLICPGAKLIKEENKIFFATEEEAKAKGYAPAKNCKELFKN